MPCAKFSTGLEKLAPTDWHGWHVFATLDQHHHDDHDQRHQEVATMRSPREEKVKFAASLWEVSVKCQIILYYHCGM